MLLPASVWQKSKENWYFTLSSGNDSDELFLFCPCNSHLCRHTGVEREAESNQTLMLLLLWQGPVCVFVCYRDWQTEQGGVVGAVSDCCAESLKLGFQVWINKRPTDRETCLSQDPGEHWLLQHKHAIFSYIIKLQAIKCKGRWMAVAWKKRVKLY